MPHEHWNQSCSSVKHIHHEECKQCSAFLYWRGRHKKILPAAAALTRDPGTYALPHRSNRFPEVMSEEWTHNSESCTRWRPFTRMKYCGEVRQMAYCFCSSCVQLISQVVCCSNSGFAKLSASSNRISFWTLFWRSTFNFLNWKGAFTVFDFVGLFSEKVDSSFVMWESYPKKALLCRENKRIQHHLSTQ